MKRPKINYTKLEYPKKRHNINALYVWTQKEIETAIKLRNEGKTYYEISTILKTHSPHSVERKIARIRFRLDNPKLKTDWFS